VDFNSTTGPSYAGSGGIAFYPFGNWNFFTYPHFTTSLDLIRHQAPRPAFPG
jgi:hypothetical protein